MEEQLKNETTKELERIKKIMENMEILDPKKADSLVKVMKSYYEDCIAFYKKGKWLQSLETAFIVWGYCDAGLHLGVFKVPDSMRKMFTV